ncbi:uncharacterized protein EHS24_002584 [Apiotrichum porosum]|uniref:Uncharacterized protein n=1 Tax=Apiotrichum porosum TaxID=105984 RepID=A0A427XGZ1_9TREE|nr:uncharacterized protein EHS24_002584 [Apiotrichum porosum]RSH78128.1 hypothetical protein EHS24_002584 [Apiotrichum porosum]
MGPPHAVILFSTYLRTQLPPPRFDGNPETHPFYQELHAFLNRIAKGGTTLVTDLHPAFIRPAESTCSAPWSDGAEP